MLRHLINFFKGLLSSKEAKNFATKLQQEVWKDGKAIAYMAIAEAKAGNFTSGDDKRKAAFDRINAYLLNKGKTYSSSLIFWLIEHAYQKFSLEENGVSQ